MQGREIKKVLVANRGEIAIRVFRACVDMGLKTVAIYSKEDKTNLFRTKADEAYLLSQGKSPLEAYLDIDYIVSLAKRKQVDAIHPGYGFLSENAQFAKACEENGIVFIGPPSHVLSKMGDKLFAKEVAKRCHVPTIPGTQHPLANGEEAVAYGREIGYPVVLKASAGGGGKGMRRVDCEEQMLEAFARVQSEALKSFGSDEIFMEKLLENPKHIEIQVLADGQGNAVHLYERDCSVQRRYQKVVEYTPAFSVPEKYRARMYEDALKIAKEVGYVNAGTVEFLVDSDYNHYFIEMNPRIQVEHTITEMVTGIDLVQAQIDIAGGKTLADIGIGKQEDISTRGYAIQCRVTTEDPFHDFAPDTGKITTYRSGGGFGVRLDGGNAFAGAEISPYYDSLLVKITTAERTFEAAVRKAIRSLGEVRIRGVKTNISFLQNILAHEAFQKGACHTKFIDETPALFSMKESKDRATKVLKYIGNLIVNETQGQKPQFEAPILPKVAGTPPAGLKQLLDKEGPKGLVDYIKGQRKLLLTDTTFRDAHQSLLATRMRTRDMVHVAGATAHILKDAFSLEMWGGATYDSAYRFLHESPWDRLDALREKIPNIPFQMLLRGANAVGYNNYPDNVVRAFIKEAARSGIDVFRIFDALNWLPNMELAIEEVLLAGKVAEGTICYTGDILNPAEDKYTLSYYVDMAKQLEKRGVHILCIKDMAGLLKPLAAQRLVKALKEEVGLPIHLHTHDTSGNQIATYFMAAQAGVDIVDTAISSMASMTSQPSMNSLVQAMEADGRATGIAPEPLEELSRYWAGVRPYYQAFESGLQGPSADIYRYEIPGGQYTNLKPQVESLGLGHRFDEVKEMYREVNLLLGNIPKVTPSSKMVGDMAIFMVQNNLTKDNIVQEGQYLTFPDSVIDYFKGYMGQPPFGFPKDLQAVVLKGEKALTGRAGEHLAPVDFGAIEEELREFYETPTVRECISYSLYPKMIREFLTHREMYGDISRMQSHVFFMGLAPDETTELAIDEGKTLIIKYLGLGERNDDGTTNVLYELNGARREVAVEDESAPTQGAKTVLADSGDNSQVGASIPGMVTKLLVQVGERVEAGQAVAVIEAMKMETSVLAKTAGVVENIFVQEGDNVKAGQLMAAVEPVQKDA